jgi:hypothetical protein
MAVNVPDLDEYPIEVAIELAWNTVLDVWHTLQKAQLALEDVPHLNQRDTRLGTSGRCGSSIQGKLFSSGDWGIRFL